MSFHSPIKKPAPRHVPDELRAVQCDLPDGLALLPGEVDLIEMYLGSLEELFGDYTNQPSVAHGEIERRKKDD